MVVGGHALAYYGVPRYTGDIDIFVQPERDNAERMLRALDEFGFGDIGLKTVDFMKPNQVVQLGYPPVRIDIVTSISGVSWDVAASESVQGHYGDVPVNFIGRRHFVLNKKASGRKKDIADLEALGEA